MRKFVTVVLVLVLVMPVVAKAEQVADTGTLTVSFACEIKGKVASCPDHVYVRVTVHKGGWSNPISHQGIAERVGDAYQFRVAGLEPAKYLVRVNDDPNVRTHWHDKKGYVLLDLLPGENKVVDMKIKKDSYFKRKVGISLKGFLVSIGALLALEHVLNKQYEQ